MVMTASMLAVRFASAVFGLVQYVSVTGSKSRLPAWVKPGGIQAVPNI